jgi:hypothetical protein
LGGGGKRDTLAADDMDRLPMPGRAGALPTLRSSEELLRKWEDPSILRVSELPRPPPRADNSRGKPPFRPPPTTTNGPVEELRLLCDRSKDKPRWLFCRANPVPPPTLAPLDEADRVTPR